MDPNLEKVTLKEYIDTKFDGLKDFLEAEFIADRKAVAQYSKTNDEWKALHNDLIMKSERDRQNFVTKEQLKEKANNVRLWLLACIAIFGFIIMIYDRLFNK